MHVILSDLHQDDYFNIVTFSDTVNVWRPSQSSQATPQNIRKAKDYVSKMEADGCECWPGQSLGWGGEQRP